MNTEQHNKASCADSLSPSPSNNHPGEIIVEKIVRAYRAACTEVPTYNFERVAKCVQFATDQLAHASAKLKEVWSDYQALPSGVIASDSTNVTSCFDGVNELEHSELSQRLGYLERQMAIAEDLLKTGELEAAYACAVDAGEVVEIISWKIRVLDGVLGDLATIFVPNPEWD